MKTVFGLLISCPDNQYTRMRLVWRAVADGRWQDCIAGLREAGSEGRTQWHKNATHLSDSLKSARY